MDALPGRGRRCHWVDYQGWIWAGRLLAFSLSLAQCWLLRFDTDGGWLCQAKEPSFLLFK